MRNILSILGEKKKKSKAALEGIAGSTELKQLETGRFLHLMTRRTPYTRESGYLRGLHGGENLYTKQKRNASAAKEEVGTKRKLWHRGRCQHPRSEGKKKK